MSTPSPDDTATARFRRGARSAPAGQVAAPPPTVPGAGPQTPPWTAAGPAVQSPWAPQDAGEGGGAPVPAPQSSPAPPAFPGAQQASTPNDGGFAGLLGQNGYGPVPPGQAGYGQPGQGAFGPDGAQPLYETPSYDWMPVDTDPGRGAGIASIAVGVFFGLIGLFIGIHSVRRSRAVGLRGAVGITGIVVSALSMILFGSIVGSWIKYEVDLASQCAVVGPGQYYTSSGDVVSCS